MYKNCTTEHSALRQQQLEECLLANMMVRPYSEISISDLCEQASISRKSFYRYFGNKDGCLCALLDRVLMNASQSVFAAQAAGETLDGEFVHLLSFWKGQGQLLHLLIANDLTGHFLERMMNHVVKEEQPFLKHLGMTDPNEHKERLLFSTTGFLCVLLNWAENGFDLTVPQMAAKLTPLFTQPLFPQPLPV